MSGQQIGTVVGGVIGAFFGMPALGAAIGGMIGGWIDPTQVNGPRIGDGPSQTSQEGQPIPWVIGTCGWLQSNIVDKSPRREVKKTDDGKGSGTEINTFEAHQDFVLMICESSEHRESLMVGPLIIKVDGKIVYDMRPDKNFGAENAKFLRNHTFYNGNESQMPDPTCEAFPHNGVGNTPYYRGVFTMVARDINLTAYGDRIPLYEFVMVGAGESGVITETTLEPRLYSEFRDAGWPLADEESDYIISGDRLDSAGGTVFLTGTTIADLITEASSLYTLYGSQPGVFIGYSAAGGPGQVAAFGNSYINAQESILNNESIVLIYNDFPPDASVDLSNNPGARDTLCALPMDGWLLTREGMLNKWFAGTSAERSALRANGVCGAGPAGVAGLPPLFITVTRKHITPTLTTGDPCLLGRPVLLPDDPGSVIDCEGVVSRKPEYAEITDTDFIGLQAEFIDTLEGREQYIRYDVGPVMRTSDPRNNGTFWTAAATEAGIPGSYPADFPVPLDTVIEATAIIPFVSQDSISLATAITRICKRGGLTVDDIDVSEMDQQLLGYMITQPYNGADCIRPLMTAFTSYGSEYDAKLRFHRHGEAIEIVVNPDDFIAGSDETDKNTREQEIEYPRLLSVTAIDPTQDYTARPQVERRITPGIRAIGEEQMQVPIVMTPDSQRQLAAIGMKVSWARAQGKREFSVPYATATGLYLYLVAGKPFALEGKRYIAQNVRLEDGEIHFEAVYDRQSAYTSDVTATPALPPTAPPSSIGGVTLFAGMNLPRLRSKDSTPGMYIAVDGLLDSWPGCALQMSIDDGASWTTAIGSMTQSSVMGYLTAPLDDQPTSTLSVSVHGGDLNSITDARLADGGNASAIITAGAAEVLQFKTSDEIDPDKYDLTDLVRGGLGTTASAHTQGDRFVQLDSVYFLPLDVSLAGRVIKFRPVTFGTPPESNAVYSVTFNPQFTGPQVTEAYVDDFGDAYTDATSNPYFKVIS